MTKIQSKPPIAIVTIKNNSVIRRIHSKLFRKVQPEEVNLENLKQSSNEIDIRFNSNQFKKKFKN